MIVVIGFFWKPREVYIGLYMVSEFAQFSGVINVLFLLRKREWGPAHLGILFLTSLEQMYHSKIGLQNFLFLCYQRHSKHEDNKVDTAVFIRKSCY